ncbi:serine/threonine-protein kinase [Aliterella atlantica]|uniref:non-specific serine/threonine protein kinase n=1 Tax=Aliterella atlantica CENA595 TaxID=1618023 RepID=A0A0D8ZQC0_9CYAN|nr:serine/threonine-protein kinase [Aliterella atlantica]KJH70547.1 hypothetical protein UH38_17410 [Aliterella atlantica CENA595]
MPLYCTKNHANQNGSSFCTSCGEVLWLPKGYILASRYRIVQQLGHGGFGRTYLAEDLHRFNERCVLKQFAPQEQNPSQLEKAKTLFAREASALYRLKHPQLPGFREFFTVDLGMISGWFLAQDYIEGKTYSDLPKPLSEAEVTTLVCQLLPVLDYIHAQGTIHRDISPDNLILRSSDREPVLIDFGGVKQLVTSSLNGRGQVITRLGKQGYAPEEQMRLGEVSPSSDLYALAVTALVLLTDKPPEELYDARKGVWLWRKEIRVSHQLEKVLKKMLAYKPSDRYQTAKAVLADLRSPIIPSAPTNISRLTTVNVVGEINQQQPQVKQQIALPTIKLGWLRGAATKVIGAALVVYIGMNALPWFSSLLQTIPTVKLPSATVSDAQVEAMVSRRQALKVSSRFFNLAVNEAFYQQHPELKGRSIKRDRGDEHLRADWYKIGNDLLNKLEKNLTPAARSKLGKYSSSDRAIWQAKVESKQIIEQTDRQFYQLFPRQQGKALNQKTYKQIWYALAAERVSQLEKRN